jgi:phage shock protein E
MGQNQSSVTAVLIMSVCIAVTAFLSGCSAGSSSPSGIVPVSIAREKVAEGAVLIDARYPEKFSEGHIEGALNLPHDQIDNYIRNYVKDRNREIVVYCESGKCAEQAKHRLEDEGYENVYNSGSYSSWMR